MSTKKPRKRNNSPVRRVMAARHRMTKGLGIVFTLKQSATIVNLKHGFVIPSSKVLIDAIHNTQYNWRVYITVMLENQLGERYMRIDECTPERSCYQVDMMEHLNKAHTKMIGSTKLADRVNVGWLAIPDGTELNEEHIEKLISVLPCWDVFDRGQIKTDREKKQSDLSLIQKLEATL